MSTRSSRCRSSPRHASSRARASRSISRSRARAPAIRWSWHRRSSAAIRSTSSRTSSASGRARASPDVTHTLACYHAIIAGRVFDHGLLEEMARVNAAPVLNMLSGTDHPLQALADLLTVKQLVGRLEGVKIAFIGEGNNVSRSLAEACALVGAEFSIASPQGYGLGKRPTSPDRRSRRSGRRRGHRLHRRLGVDGRRGQRRAPRGVRAVPGRRGADGACAGRLVPPLPARAARRGSDRAGHRRAALGGLAPGREPDAHRARRHALDAGTDQ